MSVYRIGETQAKPETTEALRYFLISIMPGIKASQGCESVMLYQSQDDPTKFTMMKSGIALNPIRHLSGISHLKNWLRSDHCWLRAERRVL